MKEDDVKELHCGPFWGRSRERARQQLKVRIQPVYSRATIFSIPHACLAAGIFSNELADDQKVSFELLTELAESKWLRSVIKFIEDVKSLQSHQVPDILITGAIIGWTCTKKDFGKSNKEQYGICPDLGLTLSVLSRRVGDILIGSREPELTWEKLFESGFGIDEDICAAPNLLSAPWNRFVWS